MKDFYFIYFPIGYDYIKTVECTFKYLPKECNVIVVTPYPEMVDTSYDFNLTVLKLDDIRSEWSKNNEIIVYEKDQIEYTKKYIELLKSGIKFPFAISRFIIPYLVEKNITNFAILDSGCLINYSSPEHVENFIKDIYDHCGENQCFFGPIMILGSSKDEIYRVSSDILLKYGIDPNIINNMEDTFYVFDGYFRGFKLNNTRDLELFYNLWNDILISCYEKNSALIRISNFVVFDDWLFGFVCYIFSKTLNTKTEDFVFNQKRLIKHLYHPENCYFNLPHGLYISPIKDGGYEMIATKTREDFFKVNKEKLIKFFTHQNDIAEDRIHEVIYDYKK